MERVRPYAEIACYIDIDRFDVTLYEEGSTSATPASHGHQSYQAAERWIRRYYPTFTIIPFFDE